MLRKAMRAYQDFFKKQTVSRDDLVLLGSRLARLRSKSTVSNDQVADNKTRTCSLFDTLGRSARCDHKAVGHWCETAVAAVRQNGPLRAEGSYEKDFRDALAFDQYSLQLFLSRSAQGKAFESYAVDGQRELDAESVGKTAA
jgi:hypothetical protein